MSSPESTSSYSGSSSGIREPILDLKARLHQGREKIHDHSGVRSRGIQVCNRLADLIDSIVLDLFELTTAQFRTSGGASLESKLALVPCGGYGRRDVVPYSDVDLILLFDPTVRSEVRDFNQRFVADMSDLGITLGFSVRTVDEALQLARKDVATFTSQAESRYLAGSVRLYSKFDHRLRKDAKRRSRQYVQQIERAREKERKQYGETIYLLEPDVKRSLGGLRDIHLLRWIGFARYGEAEPSQLRLMGVLTSAEERAIRRALDFLLRLRIDMHFRAGRPNDVLDRFEQMRIAEAWGYQEAPGLHPIQSFMRDYFYHTAQVRDIVNNFVAGARIRPILSRLLTPLITHRMDEDYLIGPIHISTTQKGKERLKASLAEVLKLMDLANQANKRISHDTWMSVREGMADESHAEFTDEAGRRFLSLLSYSARLGRMLRLLHEVRVLEKLVIGFAHARHLLQFNQYHKYTVDEHCIRAAEVATEFFSDPGPLGRCYRGLKNRWLLHLALLVHDLGKGYDEPHSDVGRRLALENAARLKLTTRQSDLLAFLVHKHLMMSHLAFRRDTSDEQLILQFAHEVGSPEALRMLYLLTAADVAAVGPDTLNPWKVEVLTDLYNRTMYHLGGHGPTTVAYRKVEENRIAVRAQLPSEDFERYSQLLRALPAGYLAQHEPAEVIDDLQQLHARPDSASLAWGRHMERAGVTEYFVGTDLSKQREGFHKIIGALSSQGLQILAGACHNLPDDCTFFRFQAVDSHFSDAPDQARLAQVSQILVEAMDDDMDACPVFPRKWSSEETPPPAEELPTRVVFDNTTLSEFTIVDIFAIDHVSLNYKIARTVFDQGLTTWYTKTGSRRDQAVFALYITTPAGGKVEDESLIFELRNSLLEATEPPK